VNVPGASPVDREILVRDGQVVARFAVFTHRVPFLDRIPILVVDPHGSGDIQFLKILDDIHRHDVRRVSDDEFDLWADIVDRRFRLDDVCSAAVDGLRPLVAEAVLFEEVLENEARLVGVDLVRMVLFVHHLR